MAACLILFVSAYSPESLLSSYILVSIVSCRFMIIISKLLNLVDLTSSFPE